MNVRQATSRYNQTAVRNARESRQGALNLSGVSHVHRARLDTQRRCRGLNGGKLTRPCSYSWVSQDGYSRHTGRHRLEKLQPFPTDAVVGLRNPVTTPPGRARLSTNPAPTGSVTRRNTIGVVLVACSNRSTAGLPTAKTTSGPSVDNSTANLRMSSTLPAPQRVSIRAFWPSAHPSFCSPSRNAAKSTLSARLSNTPTRRIRSVCCARATTGQMTAEPTIKDTKSRRLIAFPGLSTSYRNGKTKWPGGVLNVRFGSKADMCSALAHVRLPPIATAIADSRKRSCLFYPRKRTCAVH